MILALAKCFTRFANSWSGLYFFFSPHASSSSRGSFSSSLYHAVERCRQCKSKRDTITRIAYSRLVSTTGNCVTARVFIFFFFFYSSSLQLVPSPPHLLSSGLPSSPSASGSLSCLPGACSCFSFIFSIHSLLTGLLLLLLPLASSLSPSSFA